MAQGLGRLFVDAIAFDRERPFLGLLRRTLITAQALNLYRPITR